MVINTIPKQHTLDGISFFLDILLMIEPNICWKIFESCFMHLLDICYFSYKMRMAVLDYVISSICFLMLVPIHLVYSKCMHRNQLKTQLCCSLNLIVNQEPQCFDQEWVSCYCVFRNESPLCPFPSSMTSFYSVFHFHWLLPPVWEAWSLAWFGHPVCLYCWFPAAGCQLTVLCCVCSCFVGRCSCMAAVFDIKSEMNFRRFPAFY